MFILYICDIIQFIFYLLNIIAIAHADADACYSLAFYVVSYCQ
jgi:hypothetical protein